MKKSEKQQIKAQINRIRHLASLESASFSVVAEEDEEIKKAVTPYMSWFLIVARQYRGTEDRSQRIPCGEGDFGRRIRRGNRRGRVPSFHHALQRASAVGKQDSRKAQAFPAGQLCSALL